MKRKMNVPMVGLRFTHWIVLSKGKRSGCTVLWNCRCDCGTERAVCGKRLRKGRSKSCGCIRTKHGHCTGEPTPEYNSWKDMRSRCLNPYATQYKNYGGRGITVCDRWELTRGGSFSNFIADMGERPEPKHLYSIDRINVQGIYEPSNCRWTTRDVQFKNKQAKLIEDFSDAELLQEIEKRGLRAT